ncbi:hypothetical protein F8M41_020229 [Gigaspora margarita]|uniref:Uncharacterized protein n=1 Tax=Gigaspora margarita TaxID=4874 RepID=A0A8H4AIT3_GIGMA|nr:hypothetical protein F8M41_020229 [Gigaspora margarita]
MKTFDTVKMIPDLLVYKILPLGEGTFAERRAKQNAKSSILKYLKESLNLFLYCITFGFVFSMADPLGGTKDWKILNEDDYKNSLRVLNESEELKSALQAKNEDFGPMIMNALVDYAEKFKLIQERDKSRLGETDLSYLLRGVDSYQYWEMRDNYLSNENKSLMARNFRFFQKKFEKLSLRDMANEEKYDEDNKENDKIFSNNIESQFHIMKTPPHGDEMDMEEPYNINYENDYIRNIQNIPVTTNLIEYSKWLKSLQQDLKQEQFKNFIS